MNPPQYLDPSARAKWELMAATVDVTKPGNADALAAYCVAYSRWIAAEAKVAELGLIVKTPAGFAAENPYLGIVKKMMVEMHRWGKELGIVTHTTKAKPTTTTGPINLAEQMLLANAIASPPTRRANKTGKTSPRRQIVAARRLEER